ncbi:MAG: DUF4333 domain-containing protein [Acidimicrobiia bacterium]|nr:DUF4333 domain-containing protein [Acidimicrobiia bacterium]
MNGADFVLGVVLAVLALSVAVAGCGSQAHLDMAKARSEIARSLSSTYAVDVGAVRCPGTVDAEDGGTFACTVSISGQPLTVDVHQRGDAGALRVVPTAAVLRVAQVQADLLDRLAEQLRDGHAKADCGHDPVRVVVPGRSFECQVSAKGTIRSVIVHVRDVNGSLTFELR